MNAGLPSASSYADGRTGDVAGVLDPHETGVGKAGTAPVTSSRRPDPRRSYRRADCTEERCGLPRQGQGRAPAGWVQIHYAVVNGVTDNEPDRWYCSSHCAIHGLCLGDVVALEGGATP